MGSEKQYGRLRVMNLGITLQKLPNYRKTDPWILQVKTTDLWRKRILKEFPFNIFLRWNFLIVSTNKGFGNTSQKSKGPVQRSEFRLRKRSEFGFRVQIQVDTWTYTLLLSWIHEDSFPLFLLSFHLTQKINPSNRNWVKFIRPTENLCITGRVIICVRLVTRL